MKHISLLALLLFMSCGKPTAEIKISNPVLSSIISGEDVGTSEPIYRSTVALVTNSGFYLCSGTLISKDLVLTAAHCVSSWYERFLMGPKQVAFNFICVSFGEIKNYSGGHCSKEIIFYKAKNETDSYYHDIALIKLNSKVPAGFAPAAILDSDYKLEENRELIAAGYGNTLPPRAPGLNHKAGYLKKVPVLFGRISENIVVTKQENGIKGATYGDSGGSIYLEHNNEVLLVASITGGDDNGKTANNTSSGIFKKFIIDSAKQLNADLPIFKNPSIE